MKMNSTILKTTILSTSLLGLMTTATANGQPIVPGYEVEMYIDADDGLSYPAMLSFASDGTLFIGNDNTNGKPYVVAPGGHLLRQYGDQDLPDPDGVFFDEFGEFTGVPGALLVGSRVSDKTGQIVYIDPNDESVHPLFGPSTDFVNPAEMTLDSNGCILFVDADGQVLESCGDDPTQLCTIPQVALGLELDSIDNIYTSSQDGSIRLHDRYGNSIADPFVDGLGTGQIPLGYNGVHSGWPIGLFAVSTSTGELLHIDKHGNTQILGTGFSFPHVPDIEFGPDGALYVSDSDGHQVFRISPSLRLLDPMPGLADSFCTFRVLDGEFGSRITVRYSMKMMADEWEIPGCTIKLDLLNPKVVGSAVTDIDRIANITAYIPRQARGLQIYFQAYTKCSKSKVVPWTFQ